jgi:predicted cobalt transporter CbtA
MMLRIPEEIADEYVVGVMLPSILFWNLPLGFMLRVLS